MPTTDPLDVLLAHDKWATQQLLLACEQLSPEALARKFEMGPGSLQAATTHLVGAMRVWCDVLAGRPVRPRIEEDGTAYTPWQLLPMHAETADDFAALVRSHPPEEIVSRERGGKVHRLARGAVAAQVLTHGMHHRAQCLNMLRHVGVKPLPKSSVFEWVLTVDFPQ
jgi:uncharacterized damage-inducible protein DinB